MKKIIKVGALLYLSGAILLGSAQEVFAEKLILNNTSSVYMNAIDASKGTNSVRKYTQGEYFVYKRYNGMVNISKKEGSPGAWISEKYLSKLNNTKSTTVKAEKVETKTTTNVSSSVAKISTNNVVKTTSSTSSTSNKSSSTSSVKQYELKYSVQGYSNADDAKNGKNAKTTYSAGRYFIFREYNGMINITKTKGVPGAWINPNKVSPQSVSSRSVSSQVSSTTKTTTTSTTTQSSSSPKIYSLNYFMYHGIIRWENKKYSYYSQSVLPGYGLNIPGRHVNSNGYVVDKDGYIVLAHRSLAKGTVVNTPFGNKGKIYDRCPGCSLDQYDVYIR